MSAPAHQGFFSPTGPRVFAHRGLALGVPENTLAAFRLAVDAGADYLETDTRVTSDGVAVLFHDATLERITGDRRPIERMTLAELQSVDLGGDRVATLAEALAAFPEARFNIDVKAADAAGPSARAVNEAGAQGRVLITSFSDARRLAMTAALLPLVPAVDTASSPGVGVLTRVLPFALAGWIAPVRRLLSGVDAVQIPERFRGLRVVTRRLVRTMHAAGVEVHVWTINDPVDMRRLLELGVDGLVTDRADIALAVIRSAS